MLPASLRHTSAMNGGEGVRHTSGLALNASYNSLLNKLTSVSFSGISSVKGLTMLLELTKADIHQEFGIVIEYPVVAIKVDDKICCLAQP